MPQFFHKPILSCLLALSMIGLAACDGEKKGTTQGAQAFPPGDVTFVTVAPETVTLTTELSGRTSAYRLAEVRPQVSGIIQKRLFEEGSDVEAGQQLYQIDPATYDAAVKSAEADVAKAQANLQGIQARANRYTDLVKKSTVSKQEYDDVLASLAQAKAQVMSAQAALQTAKINMEYTKVIAPIAGRIGKSQVTEGALVTANQSTSLTTITQLDPMYVDLNQSSADLLKMRQAASLGQIQQDDDKKANVTLTVDGIKGDYDQPGEMQFSDVTVDSSTGDVQLRAVFPNPKLELYPGSFVRARVEIGTKDNALLVPNQSVVREPDGSASVWVISENNTAAKKPVTVSQTVQDRMIIETGLQAGDKVIVEGLQKVAPNAPVKPSPYNANDAKSATPASAH